MVRGLPETDRALTRAGMWEAMFGAQEDNLSPGDEGTFRRGAEYLNTAEIIRVEDWGCGSARLKNHLAPHQHYVPVDGSRTRFAHVIADLANHRSSTDGLFMRHVLEHNPQWERVLQNAIESFTRCMVLVLFTPFQRETCVLLEYPNWMGLGKSMWDIGFKRDEIIQYFAGLEWQSEEDLPSGTQYGVEHVFYLQRPET